MSYVDTDRRHKDGNQEELLYFSEMSGGRRTYDEERRPHRIQQKWRRVVLRTSSDLQSFAVTKVR